MGGICAPRLQVILVESRGETQLKDISSNPTKSSQIRLVREAQTPLQNRPPSSVGVFRLGPMGEGFIARGRFPEKVDVRKPLVW